MDLKNSVSAKTSFSIDSLLDKGGQDIFDDEDEIITDEVDQDHEEEEDKHVIVKPTPRLPLLEAGNEAKETETGPDEDAAIAAALQSSLFYSQPPSNILYSQWLASRNTNALFGLQGKSYILVGV